MAEYIDYTQATTLFGDVDARFDTVEGKIPSNASSGNKMVTASDIATKADLVNGLVPANQLPSFVDDVLMGTAQNITETAAGTYSADGFIISGESTPTTLEDGKTYVDTATNIQFRYTGTGSNLVSMGSNLALGETATTAYAGNKGKANADAISDIQDLIPSGASTSNKLATASDIPTVPTALSQLSDDSTHRLVTDTEKTTWSGKQDALTFDNAPTANSDNPVKSGGIKTELDAKMSYADNATLGVQNVLENRATTQTLNGVTFTVNSDKSVTLSGQASADITYDIGTVSRNYIGWMAGGISNGSSSTYEIFLRHQNASGGYVGEQNIFNGSIAIQDKGSSVASIAYKIRVKSGADFTTPITFYPIVYPNSNYSIYQPYAMTNRELTEMMTVKESAVTNIAEGYSVDTSQGGNHLLKVGKVVQMIFAVAGSGNAWATIGNIPEGFRPKYEFRPWGRINNNTSGSLCKIGTNGDIQCTNAVTSGLNLVLTWITP